MIFFFTLVGKAKKQNSGGAKAESIKMKINLISDKLKSNHKRNGTDEYK